MMKKMIMMVIIITKNNNNEMKYISIINILLLEQKYILFRLSIFVSYPKSIPIKTQIKFILPK